MKDLIEQVVGYFPERTVVGHHYKGMGLASARATESDHTSRKLAGVNLFGTYNVEVEHKRPFHGLRPSASINGVHYWLVLINDEHLGWAMRWDGSSQRQCRLEIYTRELLPEMDGKIQITIFGTLDLRQLRTFCRKVYAAGHKWFQAHRWLPSEFRRHDALRILPSMGDVAGLSVLDFGACEGQLSHALARMGCVVTAVEKRSAYLGQLISRHVEGQDVRWIEGDKLPKGLWDIVLSLSVWHQMDKSYKYLGDHLDELCMRAANRVYVELMTPPLAGSLDVDAYMTERGAKKLYTYKHKVRRTRTVYEIIYA